ncbi:hypothetical protein GWL_23910 [Herbaspirillum sp. GW103]|nr:hypothetical protein GWL_23910 [Herbaspirillum sp. GW103]
MKMIFRAAITGTERKMPATPPSWSPAKRPRITISGLTSTPSLIR